MTIRTTATVFLLLVTASAPAQDNAFENNWHQWRGPDANGVSLTASPPTTWSEDRNIKWKVAIDGDGTSTPIIWNDKVFLLTAIKTGEKDPSIPDPQDQPKTNFFDIKRPNARHAFVVLCLNRNTGKEIWRDTAITKIPHEGAHNDNDFASASPTTDGERLYCWFGSAGLFCYDLNGKKLWQRELGEARVGSSLGEGASPVLHGDKLVIVRDYSKNGSIQVLSSETGTTIWKKERDEGNAWATPLVLEHSGKTQVITAASDFVRSYDLNTGEVIWQCSGLTGNCTPCPVVHNDLVYCMSGYKGHSLLALPLNATGDISGSDRIAWKKDQGTPYTPSPVLFEGRLYFVQSFQNILTSLDAATGATVLDRTRLPGVSNVYASPVAAGGHVYITGRNGTTLVIKPGTELNVISSNKLEDRVDSSLAIAGRQMFLRGENALYCIEESE